MATAPAAGQAVVAPAAAAPAVSSPAASSPPAAAPAPAQAEAAPAKPAEAAIAQPEAAAPAETNGSGFTSTGEMTPAAEAALASVRAQLIDKRVLFKPFVYNFDKVRCGASNHARLMFTSWSRPHHTAPAVPCSRHDRHAADGSRVRGACLLLLRFWCLISNMTGAQGRVHEQPFPRAVRLSKIPD